MLVLARKPDEAIVIGNGWVRIVVLNVRGETVRLGIDAPPAITIHRQEVFNTLKARGHVFEAVDRVMEELGQEGGDYGVN